ncbi:MAG: nitric-oxide reductase large subunit [Halodesulfurarchaeum sp.]
MRIERSTLAKVLALIFVVNLIVMGAGAAATYQAAPDVPKKIVGPEGQTIVTDEDITAGKIAYQSNGLMDYGTILGEGSYFGTAFTADTLDLKVRYMREYYAHQAGAASFSALPEGKQEAIAQRVKEELASQRADSEVIHYSAAAVYAHRHIREEYVERYHQGALPGVVRNSIESAAGARRFADFALWTAWISHTDRPGGTTSYTNEWPYAPAAGNTLPDSAFIWTVFAFLVLIIGVGAIVALFYFIELPRPKTDGFDLPDPDAYRLLPSQVTTGGYVLFGGVLFVLQTLLGGVLAHYYVERTGFYGLGDLLGVNLLTWIPWNIVRAWHLELAIVWVATLWIGAGIFFAGLLTDREPSYQRTLTRLLLAALAVVGVGALAGIWLGTTGVIDGSLWWILGNEGLEYLEMGRLWQVGVLIGFVLWVLIMYRALRPLVQQEEPYGLAHMLLLAAASVPALFLAGFAFTPSTNYVVTQFWRWWVVHMWVEGVFEFFIVAAVATMLVSTNLLRKRSAEKAILLEVGLVLGTGIIGVAHHYWWIALPEYWIPISSVWSTLELTPLLLILYEAFGEYRSLSAAGGSIPYRLPLLFVIAGAIWNFLGAGVLGTIINFPVVGYFEHGTFLTVAHAHASFFGAFGLFALGLGTFVLRFLTPQEAWSTVERYLRGSFWTMNVGLALMLVFSLIPIGFLQLGAVLEHNYDWARSLAFYGQQQIQWLFWARMPGDLLVIIGASLFTIAGFIALRERVMAPSTAPSPERAPIADRVLSRSEE